jgi:DNA invertase Pin-like site-specific DNA recombinase
VHLKDQRVAIYARYSTDRQNPRSIEDQVRLCRERVERDGGTVAEVFSDAAISGSVSSRPGIDALLAAVRARAVTTVVVEDLSRVGRNQLATLSLLEQLRSHGARLLALDGFDTGGDSTQAMVMSSVKTMMGELYLSELRDRTRRGMRGLFEQGLSTGGRTYGYRSIAAGEHKRLELDEAEAAVVRRIFAEHIAGKSQRAIARELNADHVPSARGGRWSSLSVRELVRNERYRGVVVFGQREWRRGEGGKRVAVQRPRAEWKRTTLPELRIIDDATWHAAQERAQSVRRQHVTGARPKTNAYPLSGLLECGTCGALMIVVGGGR